MIMLAISVRWSPWSERLLPRVVGALDEQAVVVPASTETPPDEGVVELALRAFHSHATAVDRNIDAARDCDRLLSDA